jgi:cadmium resistance protein CadD (predicted permease)
MYSLTSMNRKNKRRKEVLRENGNWNSIEERKRIYFKNITSLSNSAVNLAIHIPVFIGRKIPTVMNIWL